MSSAILYVAIVAIWAGVLIPRWLRRDSSASAVDAQVEDETVADPAVEEGPERSVSPPRRPRRRSDASSERRSVPVSDADRAEPADRGRPRALAARRRLLLMLLALGIASGVLAGMRMAAWWVVVPPSVMLLGYLLLLRAAVKADAERGETAQYQMEQYQMARAAAGAARVPVRRPVPARRVADGRPVAPAPPAAARAARASGAAGAARASEAKIISIPAVSDQEEIYDQYADAKLRAVGD